MVGLFISKIFVCFNIFIRSRGMADSDNSQNMGQVLEVYGPYRVNPGRLSVARTIGDIEAKFTRFGGKPNVIVATPDVITFKIHNKDDFIIMGCKCFVNL